MLMIAEQLQIMPIKECSELAVQRPVAVETGLLASEVSSTLVSPTIAFVIPATVPVKVGLARGAFKARAVAVAVETGLRASEVLSTLPKPTAALSRVCQDLSPLQY